MNPGTKAPRSWSRRAIRPLAVRVRARASWRALAGRRLTVGLNSRGKLARRIEQTKIIRAEMDALAASVAAVYEYLPSEGQRRCLLLASRLAAIRRRLLV